MLCSLSAPVPEIIISADQRSSIPVDLSPERVAFKAREHNLDQAVLIHLICQIFKIRGPNFQSNSEICNAKLTF